MLPRSVPSLHVVKRFVKVALTTTGAACNLLLLPLCAGCILLDQDICSMSASALSAKLS